MSLSFESDGPERNVRLRLPGILFLAFETTDQGPESPFVAIRTQAHDLTHAYRRRNGMIPELLTRVYIAYMYFDRRELHRFQRIADGDTGVCIRRRIDHDSIGPVEKRFADAVHQRAFAVALEKVHFHTQLLRDFAQACFNLRQSDGPVHFHLAAAEKIQVGSIDN